MKDRVLLLIHLLTTLAKLLGPGGVKAIVADSLLMKQQLLVISRSRKRAPNLSVIDRFLLRSFPAGILVAFPQSAPYPAVSDYYQAINSAEIPRSTQETEISVALYLSSKRQARTQGAIPRTYSAHR
jgi:hypothetical protein